MRLVQSYLEGRKDCRNLRRGTLLGSIFLIIYVDDMLLSGRHAKELAELVRQLQLKFAMKHFGPERHILGMKISRNRHRRQLFLSQTDYIGRVLERFNM